MWPTDFDLKLDEFDMMELPGQQLAAAQANTPLDHTLNLDIKARPGLLRHTCIAASIGKSTNNVSVMEKLIAAGMNIAVINMIFGTREEHVEYIKMLRTAAKNYSTKMGRYYPLAIAFKLSGKKIRTGKIGQMYGETVELKTGEDVKLTTDETYKERCSMYTVFVDFIEFADQIKRNDVLFLDNESIALKVNVISASTVTCKILKGGPLGSYKDVFVPYKTLVMPNFSEQDKVDINIGIHHGIDIFIASFVNNAGVVRELKALCGEKGRKISIISTVETMDGLAHFDEILEASSGILVTRQELGTDISPDKLVIAQKNMIARANEANVPIFLNAHVLATMRYNCTALRSEILDIANLVLDGVDGILLTAETAVGQYPEECVRVLTSACKEAEACVWTKQIFYDTVEKESIPCDQLVGTAMSAVLASQRTVASAMIVLTSSGKSAQCVSKYRPRCPILAVTRYGHVARKLHMWRGVLPLYYDQTVNPNWQLEADRRVSFATKWGLEQGFIRVGDPVIVVCGWRQGSGFTNTMRIVYVSKDTTAAGDSTALIAENKA